MNVANQRLKFDSCSRYDLSRLPLVSNSANVFSALAPVKLKLRQRVQVLLYFVGFASFVTVTLTQAQTSLAAVPKAQLEGCPFSKGDSIAKVKSFYELNIEPTRNPSPSVPTPFPYYYHLADRGIWIFLDSSLQVSSLRFEAPFIGQIGGVSMGTTLEELKRIKGDPVRTPFPGLLDPVDAARRRDFPKQSLAGLPDVVPKAQVVDLIEDLIKLYSGSIKWTLAYTYGTVQSGNFYRYDISPTNNKIQMIMSPSCAAS